MLDFLTFSTSTCTKRGLKAGAAPPAGGLVIGRDVVPGRSVTLAPAVGPGRPVVPGRLVVPGRPVTAGRTTGIFWKISSSKRGRATGMLLAPNSPVGFQKEEQEF